MNKKTALVTGGAKGIGAAVCRALAKDGYNIALNFNTSEKEALSLKYELSAVTSVEIFKADVSDSEQVKKMFSEIENIFGGADVLVNNAGIAQQALFTDITDEMWQKMIGTNLTGAFNCCRSALPYMIREKSGSIINIASMWGEVGASMEVHYSAAKAGLIGLTKALAKEVGLSGITVNAVSPGVVLTDMMAQFSDEDKKVLADETPMGVLGTPEDIAVTVSFLASEKARFITGQVVSVNGGFVI
ncbi:MAG: 3-oxoacyl-ACP reductase FabG [Clostridia bacterium]|nr:3-oxoacyl-ACP reductase FabG [Clostridia bacterium]